MDTKPHIHQPELKLHGFWYHHPFQIRKHYCLTYGDTTVLVKRGASLPTKEQVNQALLKAVNQHDKVSAELNIYNYVSSVSNEIPSWRNTGSTQVRWLSETLKERLKTDA